MSWGMCSATCCMVHNYDWSMPDCATSLECFSWCCESVVCDQQTPHRGWSVVEMMGRSHSTLCLDHLASQTFSFSFVVLPFSLCIFFHPLFLFFFLCFIMSISEQSTSQPPGESSGVACILANPSPPPPLPPRPTSMSMPDFLAHKDDQLCSTVKSTLQKVRAVILMTNVQPFFSWPLIWHINSLTRCLSLLLVVCPLLCILLCPLLHHLHLRQLKLWLSLPWFLLISSPCQIMFQNSMLVGLRSSCKRSTTALYGISPQLAVLLHSISTLIWTLCPSWDWNRVKASQFLLSWHLLLSSSRVLCKTGTCPSQIFTKLVIICVTLHSLLVGQWTLFPCTDTSLMPLTPTPIWTTLMVAGFLCYMLIVHVRFGIMWLLMISTLIWASLTIVFLLRWIRSSGSLLTCFLYVLFPISDWVTSFSIPPPSLLPSFTPYYYQTPSFLPTFPYIYVAIYVCMILCYVSFSFIPSLLAWP